MNKKSIKKVVVIIAVIIALIGAIAFVIMGISMTSSAEETPPMPTTGIFTARET